MDERRIAEWLTVDAPPGEPPLDDDESDAATSHEPSTEAAETPSARPAALRNRRRWPDALGLDAFEGYDARARELIAALRRGIRRRPLAALVVGAGIGFVIGGALSFRAGRVLLAAGARHAARELLKRVL